MDLNPGIEALRKLAHMGYQFKVIGDTIKASYEGQGDPDPHQVRPLLEVVKAHKEEAVCFLKCHCPRCGGCCFIPDYEGQSLCLGCDWEKLVKLYPGLGEVKH